jgi:uncharacterized protein YbjT (DUF2867 family)
VAVTGAGGRTGSLTVKRLLKEPNRYSVVAIVRRPESAAERLGDVPDSAVVVVDIAADRAAEDLAKAFDGADALVIASSAVPKMKQPPPQSGPPEFYYEQTPEQVDWLGQKAQIDAAQKAGVQKVVLVGSMGGTDESNRLNALGNGKILVWKRKAEEYLIASGLNYTIIHPGGLFDEEGGQREIVLGVDDQLLKKAETEGTSRRIPRDDVAALAVAALTSKSADNRSVDAVAKEPGDGVPTADFEALFAGLSGNCKY